MGMIVLTLGAFDLFHAGHVALLRRCRDLAGPAGRVVVGLNTDGFTARYKGAPVIGYADREACLRACRYVDAVVPNDQADGTVVDVVEAIGPDIIAVGADWQDRDYLGQIGISQAWLDERWIRLIFLPYTPGNAGPSSDIKRRIAGTTSFVYKGEIR